MISIAASTLDVIETALPTLVAYVDDVLSRKDWATRVTRIWNARRRAHD
jgi:hypothetical protein